jgi:hypothetical protein
VPLAVKELRPLRGAFGVLDREPLARHRQKGPAGKGACLRGRRAALYSQASHGTNLGPDTRRTGSKPQVTEPWAAPATELDLGI